MHPSAISTVRTALRRDAPPIPSPQKNLTSALQDRDRGWKVFCCTAYVGQSDSPEEYIEPHWLIAAIENQGWRLQRLDYLSVEQEFRPNIIGAGSRPSCQIKAKLMFRRTPDTPQETKPT